MKKISNILLFLLCSSITYSQKLETAIDLLKNNKLVEAKNEIESFLQVKPKNAEAFYIKVKIYNAISQDLQLGKQYPNARMEAFNALKKYTEIDDKMLISLQIDGYKPINDIYTGWYQSGASAFNNKDYTVAFTDFVNAVAVSKFMNEKGWIVMPLDTNAVLYAGIAAEKLSRFDDAVHYYEMLVKARAKGEGFVEIYKWVANHYYEKKNYTEAAIMLMIGKEVYPGDPFWTSLELDMVRVTGNRDQLFAKYEQTISGDPGNHLYRYNYAAEIYLYAYNTDPSMRPENSEQLIVKAIAQLQEAIRLKPDFAKAQLFAGQLFYNQGVDILDRAKGMKGTLPADVKKRADTKAEAIKKFDEATPYFIKLESLLSAQAKLNTDDVTALKEAYDLLITIYDQKGMKEKVTEYEDKFNKLK